VAEAGPPWDGDQVATLALCLEMARGGDQASLVAQDPLGFRPMQHGFSAPWCSLAPADGLVHQGMDWPSQAQN